MLREAILDAVREEVRGLLRSTPTPAGVLNDMGFLLGALPPDEAIEFAKVALKPLADFIDSIPAEEPDNETTGAESTGD